jgi:excinuclease UvrABC nuclease subunit
MLELDACAEFDPAHDADFFARLPQRPAVFRIEPRAELVGAQPYLLRTANLRRRLERLLGPPDPATKRLNLRDYAGRVFYRVAGSQFELRYLHFQHVQALWPAAYRDRMRMRPPAMLKLNLANAYPRCTVTRRIGASGLYHGPYASRRSAEAFSARFLDLFKIRRCHIKILRDPDFPGCIYSEMKMCLAPCFAGCTKPEYDVEVARVVAYLSTGGQSLAQELETARDSASEQQDFERARTVHRHIEKAEDVLRGLPELARRLEDLNAVVLQAAAEPQTIAIFSLREGRIAEPFLLRFSELATQPRSAEEILREALESQAAAPTRDNPRELEDHLALLSRWYYSKPRAGEIFFRTGPAADGWPYRRILRACSRLLAPAPSPKSTPKPTTKPTTKIDPSEPVA